MPEIKEEEKYGFLIIHHNVTEGLQRLGLERRVQSYLLCDIRASLGEDRMTLTTCLPTGAVDKGGDLESGWCLFGSGLRLAQREIQSSSQLEMC